MCWNNKSPDEETKVQDKERRAYAKESWKQIQQTKDFFPYLRYVAVDDGDTSPLHLSWHNTVLPVDHPWWKKHFPPNGSGCRCTADPVAEADLEYLGLTVSKEPPSGD